MTQDEKQEFKKLVKDSTIEAIASESGKSVIKEAAIEALQSEQGQKAMIKVLLSSEAKEIFSENFADAFHEVVVPVFEDRDKASNDFKKRLESLEEKAGVTL